MTCLPRDSDHATLLIAWSNHAREIQLHYAQGAYSGDETTRQNAIDCLRAFVVFV